jgi:hypothetical protein
MSDKKSQASKKASTSIYPAVGQKFNNYPKQAAGKGLKIFKKLS